MGPGGKTGGDKGGDKGKGAKKGGQGWPGNDDDDYGEEGEAQLRDTPICRSDGCMRTVGPKIND
eukprot:1941799-Heterocapsa_arctica.AAC.1